MRDYCIVKASRLKPDSRLDRMLWAVTAEGGKGGIPYEIVLQFAPNLNDTLKSYAVQSG